VSPYWNWTIGYFHSSFLLQTAYDLADASNFFDSSFWKDPDHRSGLGGWGDANADFAVLDGGFRALHLSYPSPHMLRRNFTLRPFGFSVPFFTEPQKEANSSFSASNIEKLLETPDGDYRMFQAALEAFEVRAWMLTVVGFLIFM
jgi:tyrosinase